MNGTQATGINFFNDNSQVEYSSAEDPQGSAKSFMHPDEVLSDPRLTQTQKREILASWASDVRAVLDAPALRQLDNGAVVHIDDVQRALNSLSENETSEQSSLGPMQSYNGLRVRLFRRLKSSSRRDWPDDDDPPPCPVAPAWSPHGPLPGEAAADLGLALAV